MKIKFLLLFGVVVAPSLLIGQTNPCLFNKGKMSVVGSNDGSTILYVQGDFIVGSDDTDQTLRSDIYVSGSKTVITGDFIQNAEYVAGQNANVFSFPATYGTSNASSFVFQGTTAQNIKTDLGLYTARKGSNYIHFPDLVVNNSNGVTITPDVAVQAENINLQEGKLVLDSRRLGEAASGSPSDVIIDQSGNDETITSSSNTYSALAHLSLSDNGTITYNRPTTVTASTDLSTVGNIQVRLKLDSALSTSKNPDALNNRYGKSIVGMGSPFNRISSDYFMWNHLMFPYKSNIIGVINATETNPERIISAGDGFVTGIDLKGVDASNYVPSDQWAAALATDAFSKRATDGYVFDRFAYDNPNNVYPLLAQTSRSANISTVTTLNNNISVTYSTGLATQTVSDYQPYTEDLNNSDITKTLVDGFNYFSNPFTAPLDVTDLLVNTGATKISGWGVSAGPVAGSDIFNKIWILNPSSRASASYNLYKDTPYNKGTEKIYAIYTYLIMSSAGSTANLDNAYSDGTGTVATIAPLQMFLVYARNSRTTSSFTIPKNKRKIDSGSLFLRDATTKLPTVYDDFLFEVTDKTTKAFDRAAIVVKTPEEITQSGYTNFEKIVTTITDVEDDPTNVAKKSTGTTTTSGVVGQTFNSTLYTENDEGTAFGSYFLSARDGIDHKDITLYMSPSQTTQNISLRVSRLETKHRTKHIKLTDTRDNIILDMIDGDEYLTTTSPTDAVNRFKVDFIFKDTSDADEGDDADNARSIYSYYKNHELTVAGLADEDINSVISIYDMQGRLLNQTKVVDASSEVKIPVSYSTGAYIVKLLGKKSYVSKFLVK